MIDIWLDPSRDHEVARDGLAGVGVESAYEILCDVPGEIAAQRYAGRTRHPGHLPPDEATLDRIRAAARIIAPLGLGPALRVDTTGHVDVADIANWLRHN